MPKKYKKIDDDTVEVTITPPKIKTKYNKVELQTELDHAPDRLLELQKQVDVVNERKAELIEILKVFD